MIGDPCLNRSEASLNSGGFPIEYPPPDGMLTAQLSQNADNGIQVSLKGVCSKILNTLWH